MNNDLWKALYFYRGLCTLFIFFTIVDEISKNADSATIVEFYTQIVVFVWRQLESAFFGALTSVGALFIFKAKNKQKETV